jgi:tRNA(Ile)-lysidine synthase TilS/MesJ
MRHIIGAIREANEMFSLIGDGDRIGVGVSGGKDSTILLIALNLYAKYLKDKFG